MSKSWEQILGGYATNTLTDEEKRELFEAALHDQMLFDALADEEGLKALLTNPAARQQILASLESSKNPQETANVSSPRLNWFRQSTSLAWAGGIAAAGLALIFGWQMNKEWGPIVQQKQEATLSESDGDDKLAFRSPVPETSKIQEFRQDRKQRDQPQPPSASTASPPIPPPQRSRTVVNEVSKISEAGRLPPATAQRKGSIRQEVKKKSPTEIQASVPQLSEPALVQTDQKELPVAPIVVSPKVAEKVLPSSVPPSSFADKFKEEDSLVSPDKREVLKMQESSELDVVEERFDRNRSHPVLNGVGSQDQIGLSAEDLDLPETSNIVQLFAQGKMMGIRYTFVQPTPDGKEATVALKDFSGNWSDLHMIIEPNVPGYLYVLASFGNNKWQFVRPAPSTNSRTSDGALIVKAFQAVNIALNQVTNTLGKPVVSSIQAVLSSSPLMELGQWLGENIDRSAIQAVGDNNAVVVVKPGPITEHPLLWEIRLTENQTK